MRKRAATGKREDADAAAVDDARVAADAADKSASRGGIADATPSMAQYLEIKAANPDSLLWYRMGDFYELFFEDAVTASQALSIVLTKRGKHQGEDIPMCGVPVHRADEYLQRLIKQGYRVAVCEQLEDPAEAKKRGSKAVVKRDVVRLVTPGTLTEEALLDAKSRNYLTAIFRVEAGATASSSETKYALASAEISTGECEIGEAQPNDLAGELVRLSPSEVLLADNMPAETYLSRAIELAGTKVTPVSAAFFDSLAGEGGLKERLGVKELQAFGSFSRPELAATGALLKYISLTQVGRLGPLSPPRKAGAKSGLTIDAASRSSLELVKCSNGGKADSLFAAIDRTVTGAGARELLARIASPLAEEVRIQTRLDAVQYLFNNQRLAGEVRDLLRELPDMARAMSRLAFDRGGPRDLAAVRDGIGLGRKLAKFLNASSEPLGLPGELHSIAARLQSLSETLFKKLDAALATELPHLKRDGGFVRGGFRNDLDAARKLRDDSRSVMAALEAKYIDLSGVKSLKVRHNNILGFYLETTQVNAKPLLDAPLSHTFRHRQTMSNAVRFTTDELIAIEGQIASATQRALSLEFEIFGELAGEISASQNALSAASGALAELDCYQSLAAVAIEQGFVRPVVDSSNAFDIKGGRHPVVEQALARATSNAFVENDCILGRAPNISAAPPGFDEMPDARIWLVTGPNMAGKSTFLRQNALIAVLAQMGSFVPARHAHIGIVDRLFSRVGASDDLARGRSTFMVEMVETAAILNQATDRSLVILDEIGRGTATFDGLSIAWATVEYLHDTVKARALFATHYHEMTALARRLPGIANVTMDVSEWQDEIVFLHKVKAGAADRSYGIQVAKLAGLPEAVVGRAREVLAVLEKSDRRQGTAKSGSLDDLPLFAAARPQSGPTKADPSQLETAMAALRPDELSPKAALEKLYELKALAAKSGNKR